MMDSEVKSLSVSPPCCPSPHTQSQSNMTHHWLQESQSRLSISPQSIPAPACIGALIAAAVSSCESVSSVSITSGGLSSVSVGRDTQIPNTSALFLRIPLENIWFVLSLVTVSHLRWPQKVLMSSHRGFEGLIRTIAQKQRYATWAETYWLAVLGCAVILNGAQMDLHSFAPLKRTPRFCCLGSFS